MSELGHKPDHREPSPSELGREPSWVESGASAPIEPQPASRVKSLAVALAVIAIVVGYGLLRRDGITRAQNPTPPNPAVAPEKGATPLAGQPVQPAPEKDTSDHPMAPGFSLTGLDGKKLDLADYKGKVVLLDFWATWCGPCRVEIPGFVEMQYRYASAGFSVIGISMDDDPAAVPEFFREFRMNYPVAMGDAKLSLLYGGVYGLPTAFIIGRDGRIYAKHEGAYPVAVFDREVRQLLALKGTDTPTGFPQKIDLGDPDEINSEVPGINLTKLTGEQKEGYKKQLEKGLCTCGCNRNLLDCRLNDRGCSISLKAAKEQLEKFLRKPSI
jgi:cytochrome c biogenesis protein CcmG, thiol:disulfide interchange protein DsbE